MILEPLSETDLDENEAEMLKEALGRIRSMLNLINADENMTFVEFLKKTRFVATEIHKSFEALY